MFMKRSFYPVRDRFIVICFGIIIIPRFVISDLAVLIADIFTDVYIFILLFASVCFIFIFGIVFKFIFQFTIMILVIIFRKLQGGIFFELFLDAFFQVSSRHLQQLH